MSDIFENKSAVFVSLGCKLNFAENSTICDCMEKRGAHRARTGEKADICVINTCTVTEMANHKSRRAIHKVIRENPDAFVVIMGCYAQTDTQRLAEIDGVDLVVGMEQKGKVLDIIEEKLMENASEMQAKTYSTERKDITSFVPSCSRGTRTRYFLKIQDGCDYFCTYCAIPMARGRSRNGSIDSLVGQARQAAMQGGKEIVITGVNIGDFGRSTGETFFDLVKAFDQVEGIERYRISSIEPNLLTDEIIEYCAQSRAFMPHFHIPLQSGCDEVLKLMHRKYDTALFAHKIEKIRSVMPDAFVGVDVIVGTRGETPEYFDKAYDFMQRVDVSQYHVFSYSERAGTKALEIPHVVTPQEKHDRSQRVLALSAQKTHDFYARFIGTTRPVLLEHASSRKPFMNGFTDNYIRVEVPNHPLLDNQIVQVKLGDFNQEGDALIGEIVN